MGDLLLKIGGVTQMPLFKNHKETVMNPKEIKDRLKQYGLNLTLTRLKVLEVFLTKDRAVTYGELLKLTDKALDRITVYRTLKMFEELGIIHKIYTVSGLPNYALSNFEDERIIPNINQHLHFSCIKCKCVYCLDDQLVPAITLPDVYEIHSLNMVVIGVCRNCNCG